MSPLTTVCCNGFRRVLHGALILSYMANDANTQAVIAWNE